MAIDVAIVDAMDISGQLRFPPLAEEQRGSEESFKPKEDRPMPKMKSARIQDHFVDLPDPRRRNVICPLINVRGGA